MRVTLEECKYILLPNKLFSGAKAWFLLNLTHRVTQVLLSMAPYKFPVIIFHTLLTTKSCFFPLIFFCGIENRNLEKEICLLDKKIIKLDIAVSH